MNAEIPVTALELQKSRSLNGEIVSLPPATFSDPDFYRFEVDAIWEREWICIGRVTDVPNVGDYYTIQVDREPLLVVRQKTGEVKVLSNVCQHRGQKLAEGHGNSKKIRCPMHSWAYDLAGRLASAPGLNDDETFDRHEVCLPVIRSTVWEGFLFITFNEEAPALQPRLENLSRQLSNYNLSELRSNIPLEMETHDWDWKVYADECYHCTHLHANSWGKMYPVPPEAVDEESEFNDLENGIIAYDLLSPHIDAAPTRTGNIIFPGLPGLSDKERKRLSYVTVAPNLLIVAMPDKVKYFMWLPAGPGKSQFGVSWTYPQSTIDDPKFPVNWEMERDDLYPVMIEDLNGWRRYQEGLQSRFAPRGRLSRDEQCVARLQDWLIDRYNAAGLK